VSKEWGTGQPYLHCCRLTELIPWAALTAGAGLVYFVAPTLAGSEALTAAPCLIGATVTGFLLSAW
jgi:hypothetical protein